ncbi:von Willebrand factor type A domain-containing protein [Myxococcota bacterium]|nr:von Willebrand factor type A domain-containing protein [Myxococcota bacterium]
MTRSLSHLRLLLAGTSFVLLAACMMRQAPDETLADDAEAQAPMGGTVAQQTPAPVTEASPTTTATSRPMDLAPAPAREQVFNEEAEAGERDEIAVGRAKSKEASAAAMSERKSAAPRPMSGPMSMPAASGAGMPAGSAAVMPAEPRMDAGYDPVTMNGTAEQYTDHGVNPFTMVAQDAQSTFSIDVDTASYTIARKKIEAGALPPPAAVRVEEFVNYLDYGYGAPADGGPFAVHMAAMPDPFREGHHVLRVGVQGKEVSRDEREPVHLTFLVDVSGSMSSPDKLGLAKQSMHMLVDSLREDDTVAMATYAGRTAKILDPTSAGDKRRIHEAIEALDAGGSTAMSSGLDLAYGMAWESFQPGHENRVIVLSDGDANVGSSSWDEMLSQIKGYADKGVTLSTIGLGMGNYKDTLMEQLSNKGDGNNYYIDDQQQAQRVFVDELGGTLVTIARDVKIQVEFNPESVLAYRLIGYENRDIADRDFRNDKVDAGEVGAGHNVTALYDVILKPGYTRELATVRLRWEQPGADVDQGGSGATEKAFRFQDRALAERVDFAGKDLRIAYAAATFAEVLRASPEVQELSMDQLITFAKAARRAGEQDDVELVALMERAKALGAGTSGGAVSSR